MMCLSRLLARLVHAGRAGLRRVLPLAVLCVLLLSPQAHAVQADEVLEDPVLEERARDISAGLRCVVCRGESIDESNASVARDLRLLVRERLVEGDTDEEVVSYIVDRYGEYVLLRPTFRGANILLWLAGPLMLLAGIGLAIAYVGRRARATTAAEADLSEAEKARLEEILGK